jgi:KRAB domain-containing zinc finger protein
MLRIHIKTHLTDNKYFCPFCGLSFEQFFSLNEHFQQHVSKPKNLFPCFNCKKVYMVGKTFDDHNCPNKMKTKKLKTVNTVVCELCSGTFSSQDEFVCHQFLGCREIQPPQCEICNKIFSKKNDMQRHVNRVHGEKIKSFICEICGHGSTDQTRYNIHKSSHETERKYECPHVDCKAAFKHKSHVSTHYNTVHKKVNSYECDVCKKRFPLYTILKRHLLSHFDMDEYRNFKCEICGKRLTSACRLLSHKISHTG